MKINREPALIVGVIVALLQFVVSLYTKDNPQLQGWVGAVVVALGGFVVAVWVKRDGQVPAFNGLAKAVLALCVGLGLQLDSSQQALFMALVATIGALFERTQVVARVDELGATRA